MSVVQQSNLVPVPGRAAPHHRVLAGVLLVFIGGGFSFLWMGAHGYLEPSRYFGICGFQQSTGLPCPGCYVTRSAMLFVSGHILESIYVQPAGAVFCAVGAVVGVFALLVGVFGVNFGFLQRRISGRTVWWTVAAVLVVLAGGWAVSLSRALGGVYIR